MTASRVRVEPMFLDGRAGRLFAVYFRPTGAPILDLVFAPPFAEEMNRVRHTAALTARRLAESGIGTLVLDPYGTGDSEGDIADATWDLWLDDLEKGAAWLEAHSHGRVGLWGVRCGALMAASLAARSPERFAHMLLWQPVVDGKAYLRQLLRMLMVASLGSGDRLSPDTLLKRLEAGEAIDVAGYRLSSQLALDLAGATLGSLAPRPGMPVDWIEVIGEETASPPRSSTIAVDAWRTAGTDVRCHHVVDITFWTMWDAPLGRRLLARTTEVLRTLDGGPYLRSDACLTD